MRVTSLKKQPLACDGACNADHVLVEVTDYATYYTGPLEALMALAACPQGIFDGHGTQWKCSRTIRLPDGRKVSAHRYVQGFRLRVHHTKQERAERQRQWEDQRRQQEALDAAAQVRTRITRELQEIPGSAAAFRQEAIAGARLAADVLAWRAVGRPRGGYSFDEDTCSEILDLIAQIQGCMAIGRVVLNAAAREEELARLRSELRSSDPKFGALLSRLTAVREGDAP